ncbi:MULTISPECIES: glycoside hydrolase family 36 protein [unclassified Curtobacterium]|uniref:glycoside hydrolase family 36 protein n=1 Tax=unclassified Curtobacterium TaxID=257496 RepID=UPI0010507636|nr:MULTISPECIES: glycoside hydrolase family 36 protein [unclassified Curtobacterium]TCL73361.1 alpha-galactosidase [Curtobacterium sp. PhB128]TCL90866.1 alpha-galactosidase [Curtobacterium sp. PhB138]
MSGVFADWVTPGFSARFRIGDDQPAALVSFVAAGGALAGGARADGALLDGPADPQPLVELTTIGHGRFPGGYRHVDSTIGARLRPVSWRVSDDATDPWFRIVQADVATGLQVESVFRARADVAGFQTWTEVSAEDGEHVVDFVSSFATGAFLTDSGAGVDDLALVHADNDWAAESRWRTDPLRSIGLAAIDREAQHHPPRSRAVVQNRGSWSTGEALPIGVLTTAPSAGAAPYALVWQVEHNGPWLYELGETRRHAYVLLSGPTDQEHQWTAVVAPGQPFVSVPVSVGIAGSVGGAFGVLTAQRRAFRHVREADRALPLVFNDYMNTLMGDPTTEKLLPLIDAAADAGADLFCIDAGWYAEGHWWDTVGAWEEAASRFPTGLGFVIDHIRSRGMQAGLWLEPEVIGIHSPLAATLPDDAFVHHHGVRVAEHGRHLLDLRSPAARAHLDSVVDRLVGSLGVTFFKMDNNTMTGPFAGMLDHQRALLDWIDAVQERYPSLLIENCASGAMRADSAMLSRLHMQSTSDQQDPVLSASIAAAAPAAMLPEQAGNWAYPAPSMSPDLFDLSLVNGVLGRMYLSGYLNSMSTSQRAVVRSAIAAHRAVLEIIESSVPEWPLGLPAWEDPWLALGLRAPSGDLYLSVWSLPGASGSVSLPLPGFAGQAVVVEPLFPTALGSWSVTWDAASGSLEVANGGATPTARVLRVRPEGADAEH